MSLADMPTSAFHHIPIIDLGTISRTDIATRQELVNQVRDACMKVGFFYVKNHGISEGIIQGALSASKEFFSLPIEQKVKIENREKAIFKGYSPLLSGNHDPENAGDLQEGFEFGYEPFEPEDIPTSENEGAIAGANVWPSCLPHFREAALTYYHAALDLGKLLFPLFALSLGLPENFFEDKTKNPAAIMKFLHYPPQTGPMDDRVIGIGAHTDWECFTMLWQEPGIQALQVLNAEQQWINAPPIPGTFVINLGDQFARWTSMTRH
jgi:isopenicillin N synthase-like dioxygenase